MNPLPEIRQLTGTEISIVCAAFLSVICPGVLAIWIFAPHLIETLTAPKLLLLGSSFTAPVLALHACAILLLRDWVREVESLKINPWFVALIQGAGSTIAMTFFLIVFRIFTEADLIQILKTFLITEAAFLIFLAIENKVQMRRARAPKQKYSIKIAWSVEDNAYVGEVPSLKGCVSHGDTYLEAAKNLQEAMELWLESAERNGDKRPFDR